MRPFILVLACVSLSVPANAGDKTLASATIHGIVRDAGGRPIAGAVVSLTATTGEVQKRPATTGPDGKYALAIQFKPGTIVEAAGMSAEACGFVRFDEDFSDRRLILRAGVAASVDFVLAAGEVLAGKVDVPLTRGERDAGIKPEERVLGFTVRGPSFKRSFATQRGGAFEVWVPKGTYTLELVGEPGWPAVRLASVSSGSRGLRLALDEARVSAETLAKAFDALWEDMDRHYSYFDLKKIDWKGLRDKFRPTAIKAGTVREFVHVLDKLLAGLRDAHVWIDWTGGRVVPHVEEPPPENYNRRAMLATLLDLTPCGEFAVVGKTKDEGFAAFIMTRQTKADKEGVEEAIKALRGMKDAPGFLVDLRNANGGDELLAQEIARQFCGKAAIYAKSKYRNGPGHGDFGPTFERVLQASKDPLLKPVVCLVGPRAVSSGEAFVKMMKCLPHVTTVGVRTRGSSGNPRPVKLPGVDVTVFYSRWVDMMPDGSPVEGVGIAPDVEVDLPPEAYEEEDPTWEKAIEVLGKKTTK